MKLNCFEVTRLQKRLSLFVYFFFYIIIHITYDLFIKDKKCTRKEFFQEMKNIFIIVGNKISQQNRIPYWDEMYEMKEETEENESMKR